MSIPIQKLSEHKQQFQTEKMKVPVVLHINEALLPAESTLLQLESVAGNDCIYHHIAGMADVHSKPGRKNATGTTVTSEHSILPQVNDSDPACGMRLVRTNLTDENTTPEEIARLFEALVPRVPTKKFVGTYLPLRVIVDICRRGIQPLIDYLGVETKYERENALGGENFFTSDIARSHLHGTDIPSERFIYRILPWLFLFFAQFRSGILGMGGNHFLDLMKITDIEDPETAKRLGIKKGQYVFMIHCGSGILGQAADGSSVTDRVFFATDSSVVDSAGQAALDKQAAWLKGNSNVNVTVEGHADERGTREYNIALGERRAAAAKSYLVSQGVSASRISTISYGKERPAVTGNDESAWSQTRRAVTVIAN